MPFARALLFVLEAPDLIFGFLHAAGVFIRVSALIERPALFAGIVYVIAALGGAFFPTYTWEIFAGANALAIGIIGYHWMYALEDLEPEDRAR